MRQTVQSARRVVKVAAGLGSLLLLAFVALRSIAPVTAQSGDGYDLTWSTVDGGGYTFSAGGGYTLGGTVGQPDAGSLSGGGYTLGGGFWGGAAIEYPVYLPLVLRDSH
jgi:uncharacterized membrane protein